MLRTIARDLVCEIAVRLPDRTRKRVLERLASKPVAYELFQALGKTYGVRDITVSGEYGLIEGSIADNGIMAGYAKAKQWASEINRVLIEFFGKRNGGTHIDIGANLGLTTIPVARLPGVAVKAFEPEPANFRYLTHNIAANCPHADVELFNMALFDRHDMVDFGLDLENPGDHRIHIAGRNGVFNEQDRPVITVRADRLDNVLDLPKLRTPIVVKMDTQGAEGRIFAGGQTIIGAAELVFFEYWPYSMIRTGADLDFLADFIHRNFTFGSFVSGDTGMTSDWQPVEAVIDRMRAHFSNGLDEPYLYHDVTLRK